MLQRLDGELGRPLHINLTTKGLNVNLSMRPTKSVKKDARFISQSMVTNEVALTFDWSSKRRDIHLANHWSSMKLP